MPNLHVRVIDSPSECLGWERLELSLPTSEGFVPGRRDENGDLHFEVLFSMRTDRSGVPQASGGLVKRENDGRRFVHLSWSGEREGRREVYGRIKLFFEQVPKFSTDAEAFSVSISGRDPKGRPACARARILPSI